MSEVSLELEFLPDSISFEPCSSGDSDVSNLENNLNMREEELGGGFISSREIHPVDSSENDMSERLQPSKSLLSQDKDIISYEEKEIDSSDSDCQKTPRTRRMATATQFDWNTNLPNRDNKAGSKPMQKLGIQFKDCEGPCGLKSLPSLARDSSKSRDDISASPLVHSRTAMVTTMMKNQVLTTKSVKRIKSRKQNLYINKYLIQERVGSGSFGIVRKCRDITNGHTYGIKIMNKVNLEHKLRFIKADDNSIERSSALDDVWNEIAIMKKLQHKNIVKLVEVINSDEVLYLIMEWMEFGSIAKSGAKIPKFERDTSDFKEHDREVLRLCMRDIVSGLSYLHSQRICHSDIKPENILIGEDGVPKLADFGLSKLLMQGESRSVFNQKDGTPAFQAPECLDGSDTKFSLFPTDVWALGVTLYQLKYGILPFHADDYEALTDSIMNDPVYLPKFESKDFADLVYSMLEKDPLKRITVQKLCVHPWITSSGKYPPLLYTYDRTIVSQSEHSQAVGHYYNLRSSSGEKPLNGTDQRARSWTTGSHDFSEPDVHSEIETKGRSQSKPTPVTVIYVSPANSDDGHAVWPKPFRRVASAPFWNKNNSSSAGSKTYESIYSRPSIRESDETSRPSMLWTQNSLKKEESSLGISDQLKTDSRTSSRDQLRIKPKDIAANERDFYPKNIGGAMIKQAKGLSKIGRA